MIWFASIFGKTALAAALFVGYNLLPVIILIGVFYLAAWLNRMGIATVLNDFAANLRSGLRNNSWAIVVMLMLAYWVAIAYFAGPGKPPESPLPKAVSGAVASAQNWVERGSDGEMSGRISRLIGYEHGAVAPAPDPEPKKEYASWWWWLQPVIGFPISLLLLAIIFSDDVLGLGSLLIAAFSKGSGSASSAPNATATGTSGSERQFAPGILGQIQRMFSWIGDDIVGDLIAHWWEDWFGRRFR